jgi:hypothetical protein
LITWRATARGLTADEAVAGRVSALANMGATGTPAVEAAVVGSWDTACLSRSIAATAMMMTVIANAPAAAGHNQFGSDLLPNTIPIALVKAENLFRVGEPGDWPTIAVFSAVAISVAVRKRWDGCLANALRSTLSTADGSPGAKVRGGCGRS